jgi:hypothetical protein
MKCPHCGENLPNIALVIAPEVKTKAIELRSQGKTFKQIKEMLNNKISIPTICRITSSKYKSRSKFIENKEGEL